MTNINLIKMINRVNNHNLIKFINIIEHNQTHPKLIN